MIRFLREAEPIEWFILGAIALMVVALGYVVWLGIVHPCLRYGAPQTCWGTNTTIVGDITVVTPYEYDCTPCLERKP